MIYKNIIEEYISKGLLKKQKTDFQRIEKLILRAIKDLKAAQKNLSIDEGIAFTIAYLAMLHAARAFLLLKGLRPAGGYQHKTAVECMEYFLSKEYKTIVMRFDKMRKKRNIFTYEVTISISYTEAYNAINTAINFVTLMRNSIKKENPQKEFKF